MDYKYVGILKPEIADYWGIPEHKNKPILVYNNKKEHVLARHTSDFGGVEIIEDIYESLSSIIKKPDYVFYDAGKNGLEYYKNIDLNVCVVVRVNPGSVLKVKSWYPVKQSKINNRKKKENEIFSQKDLYV